MKETLTVSDSHYRSLCAVAFSASWAIHFMPDGPAKESLIEALERLRSSDDPSRIFARHFERDAWLAPDIKVTVKLVK